MKWIFYTLLIVNIGFFLYLQTRAPEQRQLAPGAASNQLGPRLQLLSERTGTSSREEEVADLLENPVVEEPVPQQPACYRLGPFADVVTAQNLAERLTARGYGIDLRAVDRLTGEFDYRVVMPPLASLQEAFRKLRELKSQEIDSYVITQGVNAQGISLGVFSTITAAESHQDWLSGEGYATEITEIARMSRGYWAYAEAGQVLGDSDVQPVNATDQEIQIEETVCLN